MTTNRKALGTITIFARSLFFLLLFLPCRVIVRLSSAVLGCCGFSFSRGCVTPPYGNLGSKPHHFTITGVGVRELDASHTWENSIHETAVLRLANEAKPPRRNGYKCDASKPLRFTSATI